MEKKQKRFSYEKFFKGYEEGESVKQRSVSIEESFSVLPFRILKVLREIGGAIALLELSVKAGIDLVACYKIVQKMETDGLITITPDKEKRGNDTVELTSKGKVLAQEL